MDLDEYRRKAGRTAVYPNQGDNLEYPALGLCGEAGEVANKVKKIQRDFGGELSGVQRLAIADEMGDVLWYLAALSNELGISLNTIARRNLYKLADRQEQGTIQGSGDNR